MLSQLYIKNIAVISEATIDFGPRFNVFTGETGAGKTILVSAINGVLGARLSKEIIRSGEESAYLSALFTGLSPQICKQVQELGFEMDDDTLLISRELGVRNICKINGRPATVQLLREIASLLIDVHGRRTTTSCCCRKTTSATSTSLAICSRCCKITASCMRRFWRSSTGSSRSTARTARRSIWWTCSAIKSTRLKQRS